MSDSARTPFDERFAPGSLLLDRYRIVGQLGRGGMGEVYRADDLTLGESVALKFLPEHLQDHPELQSRLLAEVRLARQVAHPNICSVYDVAALDGRHFLSMEYIDGEDLESLLRRIGRLSTDKAAQIARQLCAGLAAVHDKGIVHCDLKPGNVMIDGRGNVRIADFGLAALAGDEGAAIGTPAYMAPELTRGASPSVRSDLYALGLLLFELFAGRRAFEADSIAEYVEAHRNQTPPPLPNLAPGIDLEVERTIERCLAKDPARRPGSAITVAAALPGGDPLAMALAAGETPSPAMVAAAGGSGGLSRRAGAALLALTVFGFALLCWLAPRTHMHGAVPLAKPPAVLEDRARTILDRLGWRHGAPFTLRGFEWNAPYLRGLEQTTAGPERWRTLRQAQPPPFVFWFRASAYALFSPNPGWRVTSSNPPMTLPRSANVYVGPTGCLEGLEAFLGIGISLPEARFTDDEWQPEPATTPDEVAWRVLFTEAGLDPARFKPQRPQAYYPVPTDTRLAWRGTLAERPELELRVEAAFLLQQPVYFRVFPPEPPTAGAPHHLLDFGQTARFSIYVVLLVAGALFCWRNLRAGRGDRRGALRLALFAFVVDMTAWLLRTRWPHTFEQQFWFATEAAGSAIFSAGFLTFLYLGLEPQVRRVWPDRLIGWSRLLAGRWTDPRVGREVLLGVALVVAIALIEPFGYLAVSAGVTDPPRPFDTDINVLAGSRALLAQLARAPRSGLEVGLGAIFLVVILLSLVRVRWLALAAFVAIAAIAAPRQGETGVLAVDLAASLGVMTITLFLLLRGGLLSLAVAGVLHGGMLTDWPLTTDWSAWHGAPTVVVAVVLAVLTGFGFLTACRGAVTSPE